MQKRCITKSLFFMFLTATISTNALADKLDIYQTIEKANDDRGRLMIQINGGSPKRLIEVANSMNSGHKYEFDGIKNGDEFSLYYMLHQAHQFHTKPVTYEKDKFNEGVVIKGLVTPLNMTTLEDNKEISKFYDIQGGEAAAVFCENGAEVEGTRCIIKKSPNSKFEYTSPGINIFYDNEPITMSGTGYFSPEFYRENNNAPTLWLLSSRFLPNVSVVSFSENNAANNNSTIYFDGSIKADVPYDNNGLYFYAPPTITPGIKNLSD